MLFGRPLRPEMCEAAALPRRAECRQNRRVDHRLDEVRIAHRRFAPQEGDADSAPYEASYQESMISLCEIVRLLSARSFSAVRVAGPVS
jgi:hypothetical protein